MAKKFYAVKVGKKTGIFTTWKECASYVQGFPGSIYKGFDTEVEAEAFMGDVTGSERSAANGELPETYAFVDGSFNIKTGVYGYGGFLVHIGEKYIISGSGNDPEMASMRNVAGEIKGSQAAIEKAIELGLKEISIFYDYAGIEQWAMNKWKTNKKGTKTYADFCALAREKIKIKFIKVKGHSGIPGNEEADALAKKAVGIL